MTVNISWHLHRVEPLTSGSPLTRNSLERHHHYRRGESNPALRDAILAGLPSWEEENAQLNAELKKAGKR